MLKVSKGRRLRSAQGAHSFGDAIFLEQTDCGYAGGSGTKAGLGVLQRDSSECEHRDFGVAGLAKSFEADGRGSGRVLLFEYRGEEG